jgi:hypothetical protein
MENHFLRSETEKNEPLKTHCFGLSLLLGNFSKF